MTAEPSRTTFRFDARAWARLLILCVALLFEGMSLSSINVQLAEVQRDLKLPGDQLQLVASAFLTTYAGLLLVGGRWADHWGARRLFLIGVATFGLASLAAALADGAVQLIAARAAQGCGAAITAPAAVALIIRAFPAGSARNRALGVLSAMGAAGFSLGVVVGGLVTALAGWRAGFLLYVPLSVLVLAITPWLVGPTPRGSGTVAWISAAAVTAGLTLLVYGIGRVGAATTIEVVTVTTAGLALLTVFAVLQVRTMRPLLPMSLLADRRMAAACLALGGSFAAITGAMFLVGTGLQEEHGYTPLAVGLAFLPQGLAVGLLSTTAARLVGHRWTAGGLLRAGLLVVACGQILYTTVLGTEYVWHLLPACLLVGTGIAAMYPAATMLASAAAPTHQQGTASGALTTCQQAGGALGVAMVTAVSSTPGTSSAGLAAAAAVIVVAAIASAALLRRRVGDRA